MKAEIDYAEILDYVSQHFLIHPKLSHVDEQALNIEYKPSILPAVSLKARIDNCNSEELDLTYECGAIMSGIVSVAVSKFKEMQKIPNGIEINTEEKRIALHLKEIDALKKPLAHLDLESITLHDSHVTASAKLK